MVENARTADRCRQRAALIVVPTLNEAAGIEACLESLLAGPGGTPIIVSDGGSVDGTQDLVRDLAARHPRLSLVENPRRAQAAAVNDAARRSDADVIVRCDAHALYPPGFAEGVVAALGARGADTLAVPMDAAARPGAGVFAQANAMAVDTKLGSGGSAHRGGNRSGWVDHGHHAGLARARFVSLGGYDETMIANEDAEYDTRLAKAGGRVWLEAALRIRYFVRETPRGLWRQYHAYGRGRAAHVRAHKLRPRLRQLAPALHVAVLAASVLGAALSVWTLAYPAFYLSVLLLASLRLAAKRRDGAGVLAFAPLVIMHTAWGTGFWRGLVTR